jgi:hypothetical protein
MRRHGFFRAPDISILDGHEFDPVAIQQASGHISGLDRLPEHRVGIAETALSWLALDACPAFSRSVIRLAVSGRCPSATGAPGRFAEPASKTSTRHQLLVPLCRSRRNLL